MSKLILIRGLPGSGKSTLAKKMINDTTRHFEADMFFTQQGGEYLFVQKYIKDAHQWCQGQTAYWLSRGFDVVVSNTFIRQWEMDAYKEMAKRHGARLEIHVVNGEYGSIHNVPEEVIEQMKLNWED